MSAVRAFAPGRSELAGNHTDHQGGRVIAAAVSCGVEVIVRASGTERAHLESPGFEPVDLDVTDSAAREGERNTTAALVRGVIAGLHDAGVPVEGFDAAVTSTVPAGGGLSSSAAFELALAVALCCAADRELPAMDLARIGQRAERDYFGKPCGLMDQAAIAFGGVNLFDFACDPVSAERIDFDFGACGHALCLIDTHCDHSAYTDEYAQVARDMTAVAQFLGADRLSQIAEGEFLDRLGSVRAHMGDTPALRGLHYYHEMRLVDARVEALRKGDFEAFLAATRQSGASSAQYLQNVSTFDRASQPAMVALALADVLLAGQGAVRIHGGGFGGTVQAFVPTSQLAPFCEAVDAQLGVGSCQVYDIVSEGAHAQRM